MKHQIFLSWIKVEQFTKKNYIINKKSKLTFGIQIMRKYRRHIQIIIRSSVIYAYFRVFILGGFQVILNVSLYVRPLHGIKKYQQ